MTEFKFHKITEKEKKEIEKEAKDIINSFSKKLESIKKLPEQGLVERKVFQRKEKSQKDNKKENRKKKDFKKRILENAPRKNKNYILSEKKKW
mgnify:CR=1 FL=1